MRFFKRQVTVNTGENPKSRELADATVKKLQEYGLDINTSAKCMGAFGKATARYFRKMQPYAQQGKPFDHLLVEWTKELKSVLTEFRITEAGKQEEIILEYLDIIEASC